MPLSTRDLSALPDLSALRRLLQSLATLDAMLSPEWEYRYYSFNSRWSENESMGSMRDGEGNAFFAHFSPAGCFFKGFAHESAMTPFRHTPPRLWPGLLHGVPASFESSLSEPAFSMDETTFAFWRESGAPAWQRGPIDFPPGDDPDGSRDMLAILDGKPGTYVNWAQEYFLRASIASEIVEKVYRHEALTMAEVARLNRDVVMEDLVADLDEIGYPPVTDFS